MPDPDSFSGHVQRVKDGDTFVVQAGTDEVTIRLYAVDAPESDQPYGQAATDAARQMAQGEPCRVVVKDRDRYGRIVGRVIVQEDGEDALDVGRSLVWSGGAWAWGEYASDVSHLHEYQETAREAERGLWAQADPTPPWEWRSTEQPPSVLDAMKEGWSWGKWIWRLLR